MDTALLSDYLGEETVSKMLDAGDNLNPGDSLASLGYLGDLVNDLSTYVPARLLSRIWPDPENEPPAFEILEGTLYLADVSGFTALTETMSAGGKIGSEELTGMINQTFERLLDLVEKFGGDVLKFGGDAFLAFFPARQDAPDADLEGAAFCAQRTRELLAAQDMHTTGLGNVHISMSIAIHRGTVLTAIPGSQTRRDYMVAGPDVAAAATLEGRARSGEAWISAETVAGYGGNRITFEPCEDVFRVTSIAEDASPADLPNRTENKMPQFPTMERRIDYLVSLAERIRPFLAAPVFEKIKDSPGKVNLESEHRKVTSVFLGISTGIGQADRLDPELAISFHAHLTSLLEHVDQTCRRFEGIISSSIPGHVGENLLVLFGAPRAHADDEQRAVLFALELTRLLAAGDLQLSCRMGISTGQVFCGNIGSMLRKEYTVIGDSVNLAARLMGRATPGQTLIDENTERRVRGEFEFLPMEPVTLKGKSMPVRSYELIGQSQETATASTAQMVCHQDQFSTAIGALEQVLIEGGRVLTLCGDDGIGKRHFSHALAGVAAHNQFATLESRVTLGGAHLPYSLWHAPLRELLDLGTDNDAAGVLCQLTEQLEKLDKGLGEEAPLLALALDYEVTPDLDLPPAKRRERICNAIVRVLKRAFSSSRGFLILENAHQADEPSLAVLRQLQGQMTSLSLLILCTCPRDFELEGLPTQQIVLTELSLDETAQLACRHLGATQILKQLAQLIQDRTAGNPLYIVELLDELRASNHLEVSPRGVARLSGSISESMLPTGIVGLMMGKIDTLPDSQRAVLKLASCIGSQFKLEMLLDLCTQLDKSNAAVRPALEAALRDNLLTATEDDQAYEFRHKTAREALYESIAYETRSRYHRVIGRWIELNHFPNLEPYYAILSHHFRESGDTVKELEYLEKSAPQFAAEADNELAIQHYFRLLDLLESDPSALDRLPSFYARLAEVLEREGHYQNALDKYQLLEVNAARMAARAQMEQGKIHLRQRRWREAKTFLQRARTLFSQTGDGNGLGSVLNHLGQMERARGKEQSACDYFNRAHQRYEQSSDLPGMAESLLNLGEGPLRDNRPEEALKLFDQAQELLKKASHPQGLGRAANLIGEAHWAMGNLQEAADQFDEAIELSDASADVLVRSRISRNLGLVAEQTGAYDDARIHFKEALKLHKRMGMRQDLIGSLVRIARMDLHTGNLTTAIEVCVKAGALARRQNSLISELQANTLHGSILVDRGKLTDAEKRLRDTLDRRPGDRHDLLCYATLALGNCYLLAGSFQQALTAFDRIALLPRHYPGPVSEAQLGLCELYLWLGAHETARKHLELAGAQLESLLGGPLVARLALFEAECLIAEGEQEQALIALDTFEGQPACHRDKLRMALIQAKLRPADKRGEQLSAITSALSADQYPDLLTRVLLQLALTGSVAELSSNLEKAVEVAQQIDSQSLLMKISREGIEHLRPVDESAAEKHQQMLEAQIAQQLEQSTDTVLKNALEQFAN